MMVERPAPVPNGGDALMLARVREMLLLFSSYAADVEVLRQALQAPRNAWHRIYIAPQPKSGVTVAYPRITVRLRDVATLNHLGVRTP